MDEREKYIRADVFDAGYAVSNNNGRYLLTKIDGLRGKEEKSKLQKEGLRLNITGLIEENCAFKAQEDVSKAYTKMKIENRALTTRLAAIEKVVEDPIMMAVCFHKAYERLAPAFNYKTRPESSVPWKDVPASNKNLMIAVCEEIFRTIKAAVKEDK